MATKIYESTKSINAIGKDDSKEKWNSDAFTPALTHAMPVIAKGNIYQGIVAQW